MQLEEKRVLVFGAGKSGIGSAELLAYSKAIPVIYDSNDKLDREALSEKLPGGTQIITGAIENALTEDYDLCVLSPGVPTDLDAVKKIRDKGIRIWGEVELAYECSKGSVLAITGTNGKTTTTALLGEIMAAHLGTEKVFVVGNIGNPYTEAALETEDDSVCVAEISSFQLETIEKFHPMAAAITNITPDHLDRHHTMEEYIRVKESITKNMTAQDTIVLNYEDEVLRAFGEGLEKSGAVRVRWFSSKRPVEPGMYLSGDDLICAEDGKTEKFMSVGEQSLLGEHNYENICTAVLEALAYGVPAQTIREAVRSFKAVEHRIEFVDEVDGIAYYNDSKGTNPDAAIKAVKAMRRPTVLIGGGYDKDAAYDEWIESFTGKVKALVLVGATREKIAACAKKHGFEAVHLCDTFEEAFKTCVGLAEEGDAVLLSPACASWGMFRNYEERGRIFKQLVAALKG